MSRVGVLSLWLLCVLASAQSISIEAVQEHPRPWSTDPVLPHKKCIDEQVFSKSDPSIPDEETDIVVEQPLLPLKSLNQSSIGGERVLSRLVNAARFAMSFPQHCEYGNRTHECKFGLSCWIQGDNSVDLCGGGRIWTCCVPSEQITDENLIVNAECGKTYMGESKIVGGWPTNFGEHPWQVAIQRRRFPFMSLEIFCGGSLINERYVLTAAHCVERKFAFLLEARLGYHGAKQISEYPHENYRISRIIVHESYGRDGFTNDIALLELAQPVRFKKHIVPICLPEKGARFVGEEATVSGFGHERFGSPFLSSSLQEVDLPVVNNSLCREWLSRHEADVEIKDTMLCAGVAEGGKDSCQGDSGGPLILRRNRRARLIGIVSWGVKCGLPQAPGVYTSVADYVDWIAEKIDNSLHS